jgi:hypothetical protein
VPCIEIYALTASATKQVTSMRGLAGTDSWEDDEAAKIYLTYSTTRDINRARPTFEMLVVCIIQVLLRSWPFVQAFSLDSIIYLAMARKQAIQPRLPENKYSMTGP